MCVKVKIFIMFVYFTVCLVTKTQNRQIFTAAAQKYETGTVTDSFLTPKRMYHKQKCILLFSASYIYIYGREMFSVSHCRQQPRTRVLIQSDPTQAPFQDEPQIFWLC